MLQGAQRAACWSDMVSAPSSASNLPAQLAAALLGEEMSSRLAHFSWDTTSSPGLGMAVYNFFPVLLQSRSCVLPIMFEDTAYIQLYDSLQDRQNPMGLWGQHWQCFYSSESTWCVELKTVKGCKCVFRMTDFSVTLHPYYLRNNHIRSYMARKGGGVISPLANLCFPVQKEKMP